MTHKKTPAEAAISHLPVNLLLALVVGFGTYGAVWISDDYDRLRFVVLTYGGIPTVAVYLALEWLSPRWGLRFKKTWLTAVLLIISAFGTGLLPLLNAITAEDNVVKRSFGDERYVTSLRDFRRGGFGGLYKHRW